MAKTTQAKDKRCGKNISNDPDKDLISTTYRELSLIRKREKKSNQTMG